MQLQRAIKVKSYWFRSHKAVRSASQQVLFSNESGDSYSQFVSEFESNRIAISGFQRGLLSAGAAVVALLDPYRGDMIACLGETTGESALINMRQKMLGTKEGEEILMERPRINTKTVDYEALGKLPAHLLGRVYHDFMVDNKITSDSRLPVHFIEDIELAYVMQRYREVHDLVHTVLQMKTNFLGEVTVKLVEGIQTGLPMCVGGGIMGATRLKPKHRALYRQYYLPWAISTGRNAKFLQGVYFEKRWEQPFEEFQKEMNIKQLVLPEPAVKRTEERPPTV